MRAAVVGHVEWVDFIRVPQVPRAGDIVHADGSWEEPGGGGGVSAVQMAKLAGGALLVTALGADERGRLSRETLTRYGVRVASVTRDEPQRRAVTHVDAGNERTITVVGRRLTPCAADPLPWDDLDGADAVYLTASDVEGVRLARRARVLVATSRILPLLREAAVELDALVGSASDPNERYEPGDLEPAPKLVVRTEGGRGGRFTIRGEDERRYPAAPLPGPPVDSYGCGDSFAAALAFALGAGAGPEDAIAFAARCGAAVMTGAGPYATQLRLDPPGVLP